MDCASDSHAAAHPLVRTKQSRTSTGASRGTSCSFRQEDSFMGRLSSAFCFHPFLPALPVAQDTGTGPPGFNSFSNAGGAIDTINLGNLNVHLDIPMRSLGAYGPKMAFGIS